MEAYGRLARIPVTPHPVQGSMFDVRCSLSRQLVVLVLVLVVRTFPDHSGAIRTIPNQSEPFRTRSELGSRVPPHLGGQPIPAGKETVKFRSSAVKFRPVLTSVVKLGQGRKFFAGENGKELVKFSPREGPRPSTVRLTINHQLPTINDPGISQ